MGASAQPSHHFAQRAQPYSSGSGKQQDHQQGQQQGQSLTYQAIQQAAQQQLWNNPGHNQSRTLLDIAQQNIHQAHQSIPGYHVGHSSNLAYPNAYHQAAGSGYMPSNSQQYEGGGW